MSLGLASVFPYLSQLRGASPTTPAARIKSCLILFQAGGVSQTDTFDMRPDASADIRGEFQPIASNVPGMNVCEHLPLVSQQMDKICVVRSMTHRMLCHAFVTFSSHVCHMALAYS